MDTNELLKKHRQQISELDEKIIALLAQRKEEILKIHEIKKGLNLDVRDQNREQEMQKHRHQLVQKYQLDRQAVDQIFAEVLNWSRNLQKQQD